MKNLGVAVVGTGFWGRNHLRIYNEIPEAKIVAVCDLNVKRAKIAAKQFGVKGYTVSEKLLKREDVEAVSICTWSTKLADEAVKALKAGKHVLVEKPMASSIRQAKKITNLALRKKRHLIVGFVERFNPGVQRVKNAVERGAIGALVSATGRRVSKWPERVGDVGVVKDTAIHDIDIMRYIFSEDPIAIYAKAGNLKHTRFEDYAQLMLAFKGSKTAFIEANWLTPYKVRSLMVTGSEAIMSLNYITQETKIETTGETITPRYSWKEPLKLELQHFVRCILENKEPLITGVDGLKALKIAEAALKSAAECRTIKLERHL